MNYRSILLVILAFAGAAISSCKKDYGRKDGYPTNPPANDTTQVTVYAAGYIYENDYVAAYWKNGKLTRLGPGEATGIVVKGDDVYVSGYSFTTKNVQVAAYWKNGVRTLLADSTKVSQASGIAVNGNDIYISGYVYYPNSVTMAVYWKNGALTRLGNMATQKSSSASSVTVQNNDVYIAGVVADKDSVLNATYWKNGTAVTLYAGKNQYFSHLLALTVKGNDVYTAGQVYGLLHPDFIEYTATYWKNNTPVSFMNENDRSIATAILAKDNDVYVVGKKQAIGVYKIIGGYWKNGTFTALTDGADGSETNAITTQGDDIYIGGSNTKTVKIQGQDVIVNYAAYWKNNKFVQLYTKASDVNSIVVVKK